MGMEKFRAAPLPAPPREYDPEHIRQMIRVLEIYFNQLDSLTPNQANSYRADNFYGGLFSGQGRGIIFPHIAASDSTDQHTTDNTATIVNWNTLDSGYGWTLAAPGSATADFAGVYKITFSLQFANTDNAQHTATVWLQVEGNDVVNSSTSFSVPARKSASIPGFVCGYSEITFTVDAGDTIELYWAVDKANVISPAADGIYMFHDAVQTTPFARPAIPSAIGSITFVSALP